MDFFLKKSIFSHILKINLYFWARKLQMIIKTIHLLKISYCIYILLIDFPPKKIHLLNSIYIYGSKMWEFYNLWYLESKILSGMSEKNRGSYIFCRRGRDLACFAPLGEVSIRKKSQPGIPLCVCRKRWVRSKIWDQGDK